MQLALRRAYGFAFDPFRGMRGLGDCGDGSDPTYDAICGAGVVSISTDPIPIAPVPIASPLPTTLSIPPVAPIDPSAVYAEPGYNIQTAPLSTGVCADGSPQFSDGSCAETSAAPGTAGATAAAAQLAAALARAVNPTAGMFGGVTSCPSGYVYGAPGASVQIAPGIATVGTGKCIPSTVSAGIIPGVSNTTLGIVAVLFLGLMMMGGKKR